MSVRILLPFLALLIALVAGCAQVSEPSYDLSQHARAAEINALADQYVDDYLKVHPGEATLRGYKSADHSTLANNSLEAIAEIRLKEDKLLEKVASITVADLFDQEEWITHGVLKEALEASRDLRVCRSELWNVNHLTGWQVHFSRLVGAQPVESDKNREDALKRWGLVAQYVDTEISNLKTGLSLGYSSPKIIVKTVIDQIDELLASPLNESPFYIPEKKNLPETFVSAWTVLVNDSIHPALRRYRDFLANQYMARAREDISLLSVPFGRECYRASHRFHTTVDRGAKDVFQLGVDTVSTNKKKMQALSQALFDKQSFEVVKRRIRTDKEDRFGNEDEVLRFAESAVDRSKMISKSWFNLFPITELFVKAIPAYEQKSATPSYERAPPDRSKPAYYRVNLYQPEKQKISYSEVIAFHEGYPGHHLQFSIASELPNKHPIISMIYNSGYVEGWARYAELLSDEMGLYESTYARIGRLRWPARGMVADAGVHGEGWSADQARSYMEEAETMSPSTIDALVRRIAVMPGQLSSYDTGGLEIVALRRYAKSRLGEQFDIRDFHDRVLENGPVPLPMLRTIIERWSDQQ